MQIILSISTKEDDIQYTSVYTAKEEGHHIKEEAQTIAKDVQQCYTTEEAYYIAEEAHYTDEEAQCITKGSNSEEAQNKEEDDKETSYNIEHEKAYSTPIGA